MNWVKCGTFASMFFEVENFNVLKIRCKKDAMMSMLLFYLTTLKIDTCNILNVKTSSIILIVVSLK